MKEDKEGLKKTVEEFPFKEGLGEVLKRIKELLKTKDVVVVAFSASSTNVGKSTLAKAISSDLEAENIFTFNKHSIEDLTYEEIQYTEEVMGGTSCKKAVIIFDQCSFGPFYLNTDKERVRHDEEIKKKFRGKKLTPKKVDLWVGISSQDQPFGSRETPIADILIKNELARIKGL